MPRFKLTVEYDGSPYNGWQAQEDGYIGVQNVLEKAIHGFCGETVAINGAGRTDAGVHAAAQVAHIDLEKDWATTTVRDAINAHLRPAPIVILDVEKVSDDFDARFSAKKRSYRYRILNRHAAPALLANRVWHVIKPVDVDLMIEGAKHLIGHHDFTTFRNTNCQAKSPVKTLDDIVIERSGEEIWIDCISRSFLHNQVRSMVGSLKLVGDGTYPVQWIKDILEARDRNVCGAVAPACALTLMKVEY